MTSHPLDGKAARDPASPPAKAKWPASPEGKGKATRARATWRLGRLFAAGLFVVALWACGPVYIPVPPPGQISFTSQLLTDSTGTAHTWWITSGGPNGNATDAMFFVIDQERAAGVIARARPDGSFTASPMEGTAGDHVSVYYRDVTGRDSTSACVVLSEDPVAATCP